MDGEKRIHNTYCIKYISGRGVMKVEVARERELFLPRRIFMYPAVVFFINTID
jgi:hypothetical protein